MRIGTPVVWVKGDRQNNLPAGTEGEVYGTTPRSSRLWVKIPSLDRIVWVNPEFLGEVWVPC